MEEENGGRSMNTKQKGDIAEQATILKVLRLGWGVLKPLGDRLPYDLVVDVEGVLVKIQVKAAWLDGASQNYVVDNRRTKTNRRVMLRASYDASDFDFAIVHLDPLNLFYIFPVDVFVGYGSEIHMVESEKRQRKPRSTDYREAWHLVEQFVKQQREPL